MMVWLLMVIWASLIGLLDASTIWPVIAPLAAGRKVPVTAADALMIPNPKF